MGCSSCGSGDTPGGCKNNGTCSSGGCSKLEVYNWLSNMSLPGGQTPYDILEIRFKNSRKGFYRNTKNHSLHVGDVVVVEGSPGQDIGVVSIVGELTRIQVKKKSPGFKQAEARKILRIAEQEDIDRWIKARDLEKEVMYKARTLAVNLNLEMKISDVEYQADLTKATFYYTAEGRVDFRQLIKDMADEFKIRIEMRQIGARQEAGRVGGIGSCGRELCCSTWLTDFRSVSTSAARYQQLAINPIKLAGQCGKLKCCLNYELDSYLDALKDFPEGDIKLKTKKGTAFLQKTDIFRKTLWFNTKEDPAVFHPLKLETVKEILEMNKQNKFPESLKQFAFVDAPVEDLPDYENVVGQDDLNRFNTKEKKKSNNRNRNKRKGKRPDSQGGGPKNDQRNQNQGQGGNQQGQKKNRPNQKRKPNGQNNPQNKKTGGNRPPKTNSKPKSE